MMAVFQGLAMLFYTPTTYPGQGTAQEGRPGLVGMLTYAPRPCPVAAVECSKATLAAKSERLPSSFMAGSSSTMSFPSPLAMGTVGEAALSHGGTLLKMCRILALPHVQQAAQESSYFVQLYLLPSPEEKICLPG